MRAFVGMAVLSLLPFTLALSGCSKLAPPEAANSPVVVSVDNRDVGAQNAAAAAASIRMAKEKAKRLSHRADARALAANASPILQSTVTFDKTAILGKVFLFGADLQYSSIGEDDGMMLQSLAVGHATSKFQILGDRLQLLAEEKYMFESNINIPLRLIHEWPITHQTTDHVTVEITKASPILASFFGEEKSPRVEWVRSVEFVTSGNYLLIETSIEFPDGKVAEFMESVFPRETLVANAPKPILDDARFEPLAGRFGFISDRVWMDFPTGRMQTATVNRYHPPTVGQTIDWYVTSNIPKEYLPSVRDGIEGWNRYSQKMWNRDFVRFRGILPPGIKIGDPRYNIINWDSVTGADSAYESQATDRETGIQSHSLIYLPYSWVRIGKEFWERGQVTQDRTAALKTAIEKAKFLGRKVDINCFHVGEMAITPLMRKVPEVYAKELLKGVLFHEVGHALGLGHNFKGSLDWDPDVPTSLFASTVMDYNQYQIEYGAFSALTTETDTSGAAGPLLEYDRQLLSVLYNKGADISPTDRVLPYCGDGAADSKAGGVDPFCIRYDAGKDPSIQLVKTLALVQDPTATLGRTKSLAMALEETLESLGDPAEVKSELELRLMAEKLQARSLAVVQYYLASGSQSLAASLRQNLRMLSVYRDGTLPVGIDATDVRTRVATTMDAVMDLESVSSATRKSVELLGDQVSLWVTKTPWYQTANVLTRDAHAKDFRALQLGVLSTAEGNYLPGIRARLMSELKRSLTAPFFLNASTDYEMKALLWLEKTLSRALPSGTGYTLAEKLAAAQALATFASIPKADAIRKSAVSKVEQQIAAATTAQDREKLRSLLKALVE